MPGDMMNTQEAAGEAKRRFSKLGFTVDTVYNPQWTKPTDPNHGPESCGDPKCWQCPWMQKVDLSASFGRSKLVCIGPGGRGCEWERSHIQSKFPKKFMEIEDQTMAHMLKWHEQDGRM